MPAIPLASFETELSEKGVSTEEYIQWYYSISALQLLARSGLGVAEEFEKILHALPPEKVTPESFNPSLLEKIRSNPILKNIPSFITISTVRKANDPPEPPKDDTLTPGKVIQDILRK